MCTVVPICKYKFLYVHHLFNTHSLKCKIVQIDANLENPKKKKKNRKKEDIDWCFYGEYHDS